VKALEIVVFVLSALLILGGAILTVAARRPVRSAMGLLTAILGVAGCYLLLSAQFLAAIQLIVYAGAVVVLFLFVVMLLGPGAIAPRDSKSRAPRFIGAAIFLAAGGGALVLVARMAKTAVPMPIAPAELGTIEAMGRELFTLRVVPFELLGLLLLVAVVGAMAVARGKHRDPTRPTGSSPHSAPPQSQPEQTP